MEADDEVLREIARGTLPPQPHFADAFDYKPDEFIWRLCTFCWEKDKEKRPNMKLVGEILDDVKEHSADQYEEIVSGEQTSN